MNGNTVTGIADALRTLVTDAATASHPIKRTLQCNGHHVSENVSVREDAGDAIRCKTSIALFIRKTMRAVKRYGLAAALLVGAQLCAPLGAAELSMTGVTADPQNTQCELYGDYTVCWTLSVNGEIQKGDTQHLLSALDVVGRQRPKRGGRSRIGTIMFNSPGGDLTEAMMLGRTIRKHFMQTSVNGGSSCADACVIAFLGGVGRWPLGPVIMHSRYSREFTGIEHFDNASAEGKQIALDLQQYLKEMKITATLLDEIEKIPSDSAKTLSVPELNRLEIMGSDPGWEKMMKDKRPPK